MGTELKLGMRTGIRGLAAIVIAGLIVAIAGAPAASAASTRNRGYWIAGANAQVFAFGDAQIYAQRGSALIRGQIEDAAAHPLGKGYWLLGRDGGVYPYGDATDLGQGAFKEQNAVAIGPTPTGNGYLIASSAGEIRAFGDAVARGSVDGKAKRKIADMATTPTGAGYWLVDVTGEVLPFGDARAFGSAAVKGDEVVAIAATPKGDGYWLATSKGDVFAFGAAPALPALTDKSKKIVDMTPTSTGKGYWLVDREGLVFAFGDAIHYGELAKKDLRSGQVVAIFASPFQNRDPIAAPDAVTLDEDTSVDVNVLANDTDEDGDPLIVAVLTQPAHGTATLIAPGIIRYTPIHDYNGPDSFTYRLTDGVGGSTTGTVTITVRPVNDAPVASSDRYETNEDTALVVGGPGVLANDSDVDGDALTAQLTQDVAHGTLTLVADGSFTYVPSADFNGTDSFKYIARDATTASSEVVVTIDIAAVNDAPATQDDSYGTAEDEALTVAAPGVLTNDHDVDSPSITAAVATGPAHGSVNLAADGSFVYTPQANFNGNDSFTYRASDGSAASGDTTVNIFVAPVNDAPVAAPDTYITDEDVMLIVDAPGVLANDSDVDGDDLQVRLSDPPAHGDVNLFSDGSFIYTPAPNYNGTDSFTYDLSDGSAVIAGTVVTITITPVNDPPGAEDDSYTTQIGATLTVEAPGVLANDFDDSSSITAVLVTGVSSGTLALTADGSFTYTTTRTTAGADAFTYKVTDGTVDSAPATVHITITDPNSGGGGGSGTFGGYANPTLAVWDFDALDLHVGGAGGFKTKLGNVVLKYGGLWYVPDRGQRGHDSFTIGGRRFEVDVISDIWGD